MKIQNNMIEHSCGSPHYASPEVISGKPYDGKISDVWSIGVILFALISGQLPFNHRNVAKLLDQVKRGKYVIPQFVDADIADLISCMLVADPSKRVKMHEIRYHPCFRTLTSRPLKLKDIERAKKRLAKKQGSAKEQNHSKTQCERSEHERGEETAIRVEVEVEVEAGGPPVSHCTQSADASNREWLVNKRAPDPKYFPHPEPNYDPSSLVIPQGPIGERDIDPFIVDDLRNLGWGTASEIAELLTSDEANLEKIFYQLLLKRKRERYERLKEVDSKGPGLLSHSPGRRFSDPDLLSDQLKSTVESQEFFSNWEGGEGVPLRRSSDPTGSPTVCAVGF